LAQAQTRLEERMEEFAQAQTRLEERMEEFAQAQTRLEERMEEFAQAQIRLERQMEELVRAQIRTEEALHLIANRQNQMRDDSLVVRYAGHAPAYFGRMFRRIRVYLPGPTLDPAIEDQLEEHLTHEELMEVLLIDVLASGRPREQSDGAIANIWLAIEVSAVIDRGDVERAQQRATLLRKAGYRAIPVVAGEGLTQGATALLQDAPVALVLDGRSEGWGRALAST
jgi:exonuclease VII large subunit